MVWRLDDVVVCGEIINRRKNSVHGYLGLRDRDQPVMLQLTGNCGPELAGRHLRFEVREGALPDQYDFDAARFATQQVGPTGRMTIGRPPNAEDSSSGPLCLHLEWFSQNGRVILEILDPVIEFVEGELLGGPSERALEQPGDVQDDPCDGDVIEVEDPLSFLQDDPDAKLQEEPYGLFPGDLQGQLDREAAEIDEAIRLDGDDETREMFAKWDEMFSGDKDEPISTLFDPPLKLYPADSLDDQQIAQGLDLLLARLALHGIALDMCEHYSPRDAYRLLTERILPEEQVYPDIVSTGFVYHYMSCEYCPQCEAEMDGEFEQDDPREDA